MSEKKPPVVENHEEVKEIRFLVRNIPKTIFFYILSVLSFGILFLLFYWYPNLYLYIFDEEDHYNSASHVVLLTESTHSIRQFKKDRKLLDPYSVEQNVSYINYSYNKYVYDDESKRFINIAKQFSKNLERKQSKQHLHPLEQKTTEKLLDFYGENVIKMEKPPFYTTLLKSYFIPINMYELFLFSIDFYYGKYIYCSLLVFFMIIQTTIVILNELQKIDKINKLSESVNQVKVMRVVNGTQTTLQINSKELVIGDIIVLEPNTQMNCDIMLIKGSCLINESVITGESIPVTKSALGEGEKPASKHYIYAGSRCMLLRNKEVNGVVVNTAWSTYKGSLVGILMNPKYTQFKFDHDFFVFTCFLLIGFGTVIGSLLVNDILHDRFTIKKFLIRLVEIIIAAIPPSVLFTYYFASYVVSSRLTEKNITCLLSQKIQECGRIVHICFDKTGTLTQDTIIINGFMMTENGCFEDPVPELNGLSSYSKFREYMEVMACCQSLNILKGDIIGDPIEEQMLIKTDFKLLDRDNQSTSVIYEQGKTEFYHILPTKDHKRQFKLPFDFVYKTARVIDFNSNRKRMSVVIKNELNNEHKYTVLSKGAPEVIKAHCTKESLPEDFDSQLINLSEQGLRVLAFAYKKTNEDVNSKTEEELETDLVFLGFLLVDNPLKVKTRSSIVELKAKGIKVGMITGDNLYTGINVGLSSNIISKNMNIWVCEHRDRQLYWSYFKNNEKRQDKTKTSAKDLLVVKLDSALSYRNSQLQFSRISKMEERSQIGGDKFNQIFEELKSNENLVIAMDGDSFEKLMKKYKNNQEKTDMLLDRIAIYGRSKPHQKELTILKLREKYERNYFTVGFVGDGSNDCKALNAANMGLSIGNSESSITASFSTNIPDIYPVNEIMLQGKFYLDNSVQVYKVSIFSGMVNMFAILLLGMINLNFSHFHYAIELLPWLPSFMLMSITQPNFLNSLYPRPGLINKEVISSILSTVLLGVVFTSGAFFYLMLHKNFKATNEIFLDDSDLEFDDLMSPIVLYMLVYTNVILIAVQITFNRGFPFMKPVYTNLKYFIFSLICMVIFIAFMFNKYFEWWSMNAIFIRIFNISHVEDDVRNFFLVYLLLTTIILIVVEKMVQYKFLFSQMKKTKSVECLKVEELSMSSLSM